MRTARRTLLMAVAAVVTFAQSVSPVSVEAGKPVAEKVKQGSVRSYQFHAEHDQYLWITIRQFGVDLSITLQSPDSSTLTENDSNAANGMKEIFWITDTAGDYVVTVKTIEQQASDGSYELELRHLRIPLSDDRTRFAAFAATSQATDLLDRQRGTGETIKQAVAKYRESLPLWKRAGNPQWEGFVYHQLGNAYLTLQELPEARTALLEAISIRRTVGDPRLLASTLSTLGAVYNDLGDYRQAMTHLEEALPLRRAAGDRKGEANTLNNLAFAQVRLDARDKAIELHLQALDIRREIDDKPGMTLALGNLAVLYRYMGLAERALEMSVQQLAIAKALPDDRRQADALSGIGQSYYLLGEIKKAQSYWAEAEPIYQKTGDAFGVANSLSSLGAANAHLKKYGIAADYYRRSLDLRRKASNVQGQISSYLGLCFVLPSLGDFAGASDAGEEALAIARKIELKQGIGRAQRCLAEVDQKSGRMAQARDRLRESAAIFRSNGDAVEGSLTLSALANVEAHLNNLGQALAVAKEAQSLAEVERAGLPADLRASLRASRANEYALEIDVLMRMHEANPTAGFDARALEANERSRARSLIEQVADSHVDLRQQMTAEQRTGERKIEDRISSIQKDRLRDGLSAGTRRDLDRTLDAAERELELFGVELRRTALKSYADTQYASALDSDRIKREVLRTGNTLIEYAIGEKRSYVWALTPQGLVSATLAPRIEIEKQVGEYRRELSTRVSALTLTPALKRMDGQSRRLYSLLVKPIEKALVGSQKVIIVPDGILAFLPFETLQSDLPMLERFAIAYAPSASALAGLRQRAGQSRDQTRLLLAFADPLYENTALRRLTPSASYPERGFAFTRLPNTRTEVAAIGSLFRPKDRQLFLGEKATEQQIKSQDLQKFRFIHVAAHGYVDEEQPAHSGLVLSQSASVGDDGILRVPEIMQLRLGADMVTLSACQTGLGQLLPGEGVMGLTRAFLYAGAQSVVVSLWNVNDGATADFMKAFYTNLGRGASADESLRQAKLTLMRGAQKSWRHPYFWAPFILVGDAATAKAW